MTLSTVIDWFLNTEPGPVLEDGKCRLVQLPDGELVECDGLADAERLMDEWEFVNEARLVQATGVK